MIQLLIICLTSAFVLHISSAQQSVGTLCLTRNGSNGMESENCSDFALEELPNIEDPSSVLHLKIFEVDEPLLDPEVLKPFVNLKELVIRNNNFEHIARPFPELLQLKNLEISGTALKSLYYASGLPVMQHNVVQASVEKNGSKKPLKLLTEDAFEAINGEHKDEILKWVYSDRDNFLLDEAVEELLKEEARKSGLKHFDNVEPHKNVFANLKQLKSLNISFNKLTELKVDLKFVLPNLEEVDISGNPFKCTEELTWIQTWSVFKHKWNESFCGPGVPILNGVLLSRGLDLVQKVDIECPSQCLCKLDRVPKSDALMAAVVVNCSSLGLERLPEQLPRDIIVTLDMKNNSVRDLRPIASSPYYEQVHRLFLDHNNISSLSGLEGSAWLANIQALSLQGNKLTHIPTYAFEEALKSQKHSEMWFGSNPWKCDCASVPDMQTFLAKYSKNVKDVGSMRCADVEDDVNSLKKITEVALESICIEESNGVLELLNVINVAFGLMTLLLVGNLLYDYYQFRRTAKSHSLNFSDVATLDGGDGDDGPCGIKAEDDGEKKED